jgi:hypothetical protein
MPHSRFAGAVAVIAILVLAGCESVSRDAPQGEPDHRQLCTGEQVEALVRDFLVAFNAGRLNELDGLIALEPDFQWYSVKGPEERLREAAFDRSTLIPYFEDRHRSGERLILRRFRFNGYSQELGHFDYDITRSASAIAEMRYVGKGAAVCRASGAGIVAWSMGPET